MYLKLAMVGTAIALVIGVYFYGHNSGYDKRDAEYAIAAQKEQERQHAENQEAQRRTLRHAYHSHSCAMELVITAVSQTMRTSSLQMVTLLLNASYDSMHCLELVQRPPWFRCIWAPVVKNPTPLM